MSKTTQAMTSQIDEMVQVPDPVLGTRANGWFDGYGCCWCAASRAWFPVVSFDASEIAENVAKLFKAAGATVTLSNEGGLFAAQQGRGL
jgi:hypothetical protein